MSIIIQIGQNHFQGQPARPEPPRGRLRHLLAWLASWFRGR